MIGKTLKGIMEDRELEIRDIEGMTGLPYMTIRSYVKNIRIPSLYNAVIIAKALGIGLNNLLDEEYKYEY